VVRSDGWARHPGLHQGREPHQGRRIPDSLSFISAVGSRGRPHLAGRGACGMKVRGPPLTPEKWPWQACSRRRCPPATARPA